MWYKKFSRVWPMLAACLLVVAMIAMPLRALAAALTISQDGPYMAVDTSMAAGTGEWRLHTVATALPNTNGAPANVSLVFGYSDSQNYYYANYAATSGAGLSGVYRVSGGVRTAVATYNAPIAANQSYELEVRHKDGAVRVYLGTTMLYKVSNVSLGGTKLGVATVNGNATISEAAHVLASVTTALNLSFVGSEPGSVPGPPTIQLSAPLAGATLSGIQRIAATVSDVQGISAVQFQMDGTALGAADTTAPYELNWDTSTAANGAHTLRAVATTANGQVTSADVAVNVNNVPTPLPASTFVVSQEGLNAGIDTQHSTAGAGEWRVASTATATAENTPANFSIVFGYSNSTNYYYANFASSAAPGLSGVYKVVNGVSQKVVGFASFITPGVAAGAEVRFKDSEARVYLNGTYVTKASGITTPGPFAGVAVFGGNASFAASTVKLGTVSYGMALTAEAIIATPENPYLCLPTPSNSVRTQSVGRYVPVATSADLKAALQAAQPGDTIALADGVYTDAMLVGNYTGSFAITASGQAENPITLIGSRSAVIDGNGINGRYGLYLNGARYWNLVGFTVANAAKGIVLDGSSHIFLEDMLVTNVGDEAVHFRAFSSDNVVKHSEISHTGKSSPQFGEGVYIGSASGANWGVYSGGQPDASDRNIIIGNNFHDFAAEGIDIKEGSSQNYIAGNTFEGSAISGQNSADSWVDVKGNCNFLENNSGANTLLDGFQVHNVIGTWGAKNLFRNNTATVNAAGYGIYIDYNALSLGNLVECNNVVVAAGAGQWNVPCVQPPAN